MHSDHSFEKETQNTTSAGITLPVLAFGTLGLFCLFMFTMVKGSMKDIFQPRRILKQGRPPWIPGFFTWIPIVYKTDEQFLVHTCGVDGVMLLRFLKMGYRLFFILSIIGLGILAPINYHTDPPEYPPNASYFELEAILLPALTIDNIKSTSESGYILFILLGFVWINSLIAFAFLLHFYKNFIALKLHHDEYALIRTKMSKVEMRTCFIVGVPKELRNEMHLATYIENFGVGKVENVVLVRNWSQLQDAVQKRAFYLEQLEQLYTLSEKINPVTPDTRIDENAPAHYTDAEIIVREIESRYRRISRPYHYSGFLGMFGEKVDSVEFNCKEFLNWDNKVQRLRKTSDRSTATHVAFVTLQSPMSATLLSQCVIHSNTFSMICRMAPEPRDVFWPNLSSRSAHNYSKFFRSIIAATIMILLVTSSTIVVSSLAALIDLEQLSKEFPFLQFIQDIPPAWRQFIQGIIPPSLLTLWNSLLPSVLLTLCHLQGLEAESWIQVSLLSKYFYYQIWNVIIVIPLANTLVWKILVNPQKIIERLGEMLPKASTTLLNFIILQGLAVFPAQLLLASPLFFTWITRLFYTSTARQQSNSYYPSMLTFSVVNYGYIYPVPILVFVIGMCYSIISPIILPFCCIFFAIGYFVMKYILMYVHFPDYESKGLATTFVVNRCLGGMVLMQLTLMGVLTLKTVDKKNGSSSEWSLYAQMVVGILPLFFITFVAYTLINQAAKRQIRNIPIEIIGKVQRYFLKYLTKKRQAGSHESFEALQEETRLMNRISIFRSSSQVQFEVENENGSVEMGGNENRASRFSIQQLLSPNQRTSPFWDHLNEDSSIGITQQQHSSYDLVEDQADEEEVALLEGHLEPPMTRCPGILNIPVGGSMLRYGEQDLMEGIYEDGQLHSYYHPALIGKLPIAWFKGQVFQELRHNQDREQKIMMGRLTSQQRLAVDEDLENAEENNGIGGFFSVLDGLTSIVHLTLF